MKKLLFGVSINKMYIILVALVSLFIIGSYFSFAMFTVTKEKSNAISIVTGNLTYKLEVDGKETNTLTVPYNSVKDFTITLSNPNNRIARFNFYYVGELATYTKIGYIMTNESNILPDEKGINLEKTGTIGSSNTYIVRVINNSENDVTFTLGVRVGLDYNDLTLPSNGHLIEEITYKGEVENVILDDISKDSLYDDGTDTFITGRYPNNYIWYSGKLWRAVSVNNEEKTVKLVTEWDISAIYYDDNSSAFKGSFIETWLNDTSVDGFLGNLRDYESFIVVNSEWNATMDNRKLGNITRPNRTTIVTDAVGLLNMYEYQSSFLGTDYSNGYLNNGVEWWTLTPYDNSVIRYIDLSGNDSTINVSDQNVSSGIRPVINLKNDIKIVNGNGTISNPYRLDGDNDTNLSGTYLKDRYSGEYIQFGTGENNLYRIVSHEDKIGTKITSAKVLKTNDTSIFVSFGNNSTFTSTEGIGIFLNGEYLNNYLTDMDKRMINDSTLWYLGTIQGSVSYRLTKYTTETSNVLITNTTKAKVGLLRFGELMAGQFDRNINNHDYSLLTPWSDDLIKIISFDANAGHTFSTKSFAVKPALNLKGNVIITGGTGLKDDPFILSMN